MKRRVVITSVGVVSPLGNSPDAILDRMARGDAPFESSQHLEEQAVCPVSDFDVSAHIGRFKNKRYLNRGARMAVAAAADAIRDSGLNRDLLADAGLFVGAGPHLDLTDVPDVRNQPGQWSGVPALWMLPFLPNTAASVIAQLFGIHGENSTTGSACAASLTAIGEAFRRVRDGYLDLALAGGGDSRLSYGALMAYQKADALSGNHFQPQSAIRPFDQARNGFVPGEGGAIFVLESLEHAQARNAAILAEVYGYGATMDGHAMTAPAPDGKWAEAAVTRALDDAGVGPDRVDLISAHGTGTQLNDAVEAHLIQRVFAESKPVVAAIKSWIGHLASACGAVELAVGIGIIGRGWVPEIRNLKDPCVPDVGFVSTPQNVSIETLLLENFGFGGQNAALVVKKWSH